MKRELLIVAGVFVPFALLVTAAFYFSPVASVAPVAPLAPVRVVAAPAPDPSTGSKQAPVPRGGEGAEAVSEFPPELIAPLSAVLPEVRRCFTDQHLKAPHEVNIHFTPTRNGGFDQVQVDEQNPYLAACLEDVFAEVSWHPDGRQTWAPAAHTFRFGTSPD